MGAVDTTYTFTATDTITSAKMNNIIDQTTITSDAIIGTTLDVASGKLKIRSAGITSNEMGAASVTQSALASNVAGNGPAFFAVTSGYQNITTPNIDTQILLTETLDTNNNFNNSRFTVSVAGVYSFTATTGVELAPSSTATNISSHAMLYKNGSRLVVGSFIVNSPGNTISSVSCITNLNVGDYIELVCYTNFNGTGIRTMNSPMYNFLSGCLIRSA